MKDAVLLELARRFESDAREPVCEDGSPEAQRRNDTEKGRRAGKREAAEMLRALIQLLGE